MGGCGVERHGILVMLDHSFFAWGLCRALGVLDYVMVQ